MSTTLLCNRAPEPGSVGGVNDGVKFSLRSDAVIDRSQLNVYHGTGGAFYPGGALPRDCDTDFRLVTKFSSGINPADVSLDADELVITKATASQVQAASLFFGGSQAPAGDNDNLMLEFTLRLADTDVANVTINVADDQHELAGPECGFVIGDTGVVVRFLRDTAGPGGNRWVELHNGKLSQTGQYPPIGTVLINHDWDQSQAWTYKLLWCPKLDLLRLYVSTGMDSTETDLLLVDAKVSDLPSIPDDEIRANLPQVFFGHGLSDPTSISRWGSVYFHNIVDKPIRSGAFYGKYTGQVSGDHLIKYDVSTLPDKAVRPWGPTPFGTVGGEAILNNGKLLISSLVGKSYGFNRYELNLGDGVVVQFDMAGILSYVDESTVNTGVEIYLDDGTKYLRFCFLYKDGVRYVGVLLDESDPSVLASYAYTICDWSVEHHYTATIGDGQVYTARADIGDDGTWSQIELVAVEYALLPASRGGDLVPNIGFLVNGEDRGATDVDLSMSAFRYSPFSEFLFDVASPSSPWSAEGTGSRYEDDGVTVLEDTTDTDFYYTGYTSPDLDATSGVSLFFFAQVVSYERDGLVDPIRAFTGVGVSIDNGENQYTLLFADGGPELGKIMFVATMEDYDANLEAIRAGEDSVAGTYVSVDWTLYKLYEIVAEGTRMSIRTNYGVEGSVGLEVDSVSVPTTGGGGMIKLGSLSDEATNVSNWGPMFVVVSGGVDVSAKPVLSIDELQSRFNHAVNTIVESDTVP